MGVQTPLRFTENWYEIVHGDIRFYDGIPLVPLQENTISR